MDRLSCGQAKKKSIILNFFRPLLFQGYRKNLSFQAELCYRTLFHKEKKIIKHILPNQTTDTGYEKCTMQTLALDLMSYQECFFTKLQNP